MSGACVRTRSAAHTAAMCAAAYVVCQPPAPRRAAADEIYNKAPSSFIYLLGLKHLIQVHNIKHKARIYYVYVGI